jgi:hypothetical protein
MKTVFILIPAFLGGLLFGIVFVRLCIWVSNIMLGRKVRKDILRKNLSNDELKRRNFFFRNKAYNLAEEVQYDLNKRVGLFQGIKDLFSKKGVSEYGNTRNAGNLRDRGEQVSSPREGTSSPSTTDTATTTGEQPSTNTAETRGE